MKHLKLEITEQDILDGIKKNSACCPIALAVKRAFPDWQEVEVSDDGIKVLDGFNTTWLTGDDHIDNLVSFMDRFDNSRTVGPFTVEVTFEEEEREPLDWDY